MLPLIISCGRSWNFAWHLLWRSTTESNIIVKLLAISQTIHTVCCEDDYFTKGKLKLFNSLFHSVYRVFPKSLFSMADLFATRYLWVVCNEEKCCVVAKRGNGSLGWFTWLVYVHTYCVPIATLNQNKRARLLYLDDAQIIIVKVWKLCEKAGKYTEYLKNGNLELWFWHQCLPKSSPRLLSVQYLEDKVPCIKWKLYYGRVRGQIHLVAQVTNKFLWHF